MTLTQRYAGIRSILESPILDEERWPKVANYPADAVFVDLEDSVPHARKAEARERACAILADRAALAGKVIIARPNHLSTPWGADDIAAFAASGVDALAYPKLQNPAELENLLNDWPGSSRPDIFAIIETAQAVLAVNQIAAVDGVQALIFGPADLSRDSGIPLYGPSGDLNEAFLPARVNIVLAGAAHRRLVVEGVPTPNLRDADDVSRRLLASRMLGFRAVATYYAPHVGLINSVFSPTQDEISDAAIIIAAYEGALSSGRAAVSINGRPILIHDYHDALEVINRAEGQKMELDRA